MANEDHVEGIYQGDEFHAELESMNAVYGRGRVVSITWDQTIIEKRLRMGMVVCQLQYGMCARKFRVIISKGGYSLFFAGHQSTKATDYFDHELE